MTPVEFAQSIKAKYPDYATVPDTELATRMLEKYPEYRDRVQSVDFSTTNQTDAAGTPVVAPSLLSRTASIAGDVALGAMKGAGSTVFGLGKMVRDYTPIGRISDAIHPGSFEKKPSELVPSNTAQKVGYTGEQIGEFFIPTGAAGKVGRVAEVAKSGALTMAQGGTPTQAGTSAALSAVIPGVGALRNRLAGRLEEGAEKGVQQALGATKERYKAIAARLTPEILKRGLRGSRESLQAKAAETLETVGTQLDDALTKFGSQPVGTAPITTALETAKDAFRTASPSTGKIVEFEPRAIKQLGGLQQVIADLGPDATVTQLVAVRRAWDKVVSQAGGFAQRSGGAIGVPLKDQSEAWAKREATGAIRKVLEADVPELAAINKEWAFWKNLDDVLTQTLQRTQPQGPGLLRQGAEIAGQAVGATRFQVDPATLDREQIRQAPRDTISTRDKATATASANCGRKHHNELATP
jgi:hypothetical protein